MTFGHERTLFLADAESGLGVDGLSGGGGLSGLSLVPSPSPFDGIGGNLLVGYKDLVFL